MDLRLSIKLFFSLFSLQRGNMRRPNWRRFFISLFLLPLFIIVLLSNRIFMLFDYVLFFGFRKIRPGKPVFIVSAPRSATTYLFHRLAAQRDHITCFHLWEIIFAPSITQKYILIGVNKIDHRIGKPLRRIVLFAERKIFASFRKIHFTGLGQPEEDEAILLWNMSTIYLNFFFPDTRHFDDYFLFDDRLPAHLRERIMRYYYRCVQRHCYVFNRDGKKRFLSKNPAMLSKIQSLHALFPDAMILNINRCPGKVIPSTIALNEHIYRFFTPVKPSKEISERTKEILIHWYRMAHRDIAACYPENTVTIDFRKLVSGDETTLQNIFNRTGIPMNFAGIGEQNDPHVQSNVSANHYEAISGEALEKLLSELPFLVPFSSQPLNAVSS